MKKELKEKTNVSSIFNIFGMKEICYELKENETFTEAEAKSLVEDGYVPIVNYEGKTAFYFKKYIEIGYESLMVHKFVEIYFNCRVSYKFIRKENLVYFEFEEDSIKIEELVAMQHELSKIHVDSVLFKDEKNYIIKIIF